MNKEKFQQCISNVENLVNAFIGFIPEELEDFQLNEKASLIRKLAQEKGILMAERLVTDTTEDIDYIRIVGGRNSIEFQRLSNFVAMAVAVLINAEALNHIALMNVSGLDNDLYSRILIARVMGLNTLNRLNDYHKTPETMNLLFEVRSRLQN